MLMGTIFGVAIFLRRLFGIGKLPREMREQFADSGCETLVLLDQFFQFGERKFPEYWVNQN